LEQINVEILPEVSVFPTYMRVNLQLIHEINDMKQACPNCSSPKVRRIIYGLPTGELLKEAKKGKILLGGCCIELNSPDRQCKDCGHTWQDNFTK
jgi:formate-dependent nitrite reductase cytochrome c552 subunit